MAVAIHCKLTKRIDYHFKNLNVTKWTFFGAWNVPKNTAKFQSHPFVGNNKNSNDYAGTPAGAEAASENDKEYNSPLFSRADCFDGCVECQLSICWKER